MLTNKELKEIENTVTLLTAIFDYANRYETLYQDTGITAYEIDQKIVQLNYIHAKAMIQKHKRSEHANVWNKAHPERHNETNKKSYAKRHKK